MDNWTDSKRKDIKNIPLMLELGFKLQFSQHDMTHKRITPENPPIYGVNFTKNDLVIWLVKGKWQTAYLNNRGLYITHRMYDEISDAAKRISSL